MEFQITPELAGRINQGIDEAQRVIDREMKYSATHRNTNLIAKNEAHIAKMRDALRAGVLVAA